MFQQALSIYRRDPVGFQLSALRMVLVLTALVAIWNINVGIKLCSELSTHYGQPCFP